MYEFNLLVSCSWGAFRQARGEILKILRMLGDEHPEIRSTIARGIIGVRTSIDAREVVREVKRLFEQEPPLLNYTLKWIPVDTWSCSDLDSMKLAVKELKNKILPGEKWRITLEKRRYTRHHSIEIIKELAELIDEKVDLEKPDKILRIDVIGKYAGFAVLKLGDIFSTKHAKIF